MKDKRVPILVFIYNSYKDPLFQNLLLGYIKALAETGRFSFELVTFEHAEFALTPTEREAEKCQLLDHHIRWHPQTFHTGRFLLIKKAFDLMIAFFTVLKIKLLHRPKFIFAFANVAAAISVILSKLLRLELVIYSYEPHSEFLAELGLWNRNGLNYKVLNYLEKKAGRQAKHVLTGTRYGVTLLEEMNSEARLYRAPTAVDPKDFDYRPEGRTKIRNQYQIGHKYLVLYIGKFGDLYYTEEVADLFQSINQQIPNAHFLIVSKYDHDTITSWMTSRGFNDAQYNLNSNLTDEEVKEYLSAADLGISAVPPTPSQKFRSPTKVAEYLLCGLPYITCAGVSEDDLVAVEHKVGVVVDDFSNEALANKRAELLALWEENRAEQRKRCREVGLGYRSNKIIIDILLEIFSPS
ncbi:glycosyltransferase [Reichenbachiella sp.]